MLQTRSQHADARKALARRAQPIYERCARLHATLEGRHTEAYTELRCLEEAEARARKRYRACLKRLRQVYAA